MRVVEQEDFEDEAERVEKTTGGLWEENEVEIHYNKPIIAGKKIKCPHLGERFIVRREPYYGSTYDMVYANCPRVIVAVNEGGYNSTGTCLDCVLAHIIKISPQ